MIPWKEILYHYLFFIVFLPKFSSINGNNDTTSIASSELTGFSGRVINGTKATWGRFPFIVSVRHSTNRFHFCSGNLLSERWVITAAHCVSQFQNEPSFLTLIAGDIQLHPGTHHRQESLGDKIILHPEHSTLATTNDIALLSLKTPFQFNEYVTSISMASTLPAPNTLCTVAGWGQYEPSNQQGSNDLLYMDVPLLSDEVCKSVLAYKLTPCRICAGYLETGSIFCGGDSGGPLECNGLLTGIVSGGLGCHPPNPPGLYSKVPYFRDWAMEIIKAHGGMTYEATVNGTIIVCANCSIAIHMEFWFFCSSLLLIFINKYILSS